MGEHSKKLIIIQNLKLKDSNFSFEKITRTFRKGKFDVKMICCFQVNEEYPRTGLLLFLKMKNKQCFILSILCILFFSSRITRTVQWAARVSDLGHNCIMLDICSSYCW